MEAQGVLRQFLIIGVLGLVVVSIAIGLNFWLNGETEKVAQSSAASPTAPALPNQSARGSGIPVPALPPVAAYRPGAEPEAAAKSEKTPAVLANPAKPEFDVVRINPDGDAVIAGRATPGAKIQILDGGKPIGTVTADSRGEWVFLPNKPLPSGKRELGLTMSSPDGKVVESDSIVILSVPTRSGAKKDQASVANADKTGEIKGPLAVLVPKDGKGPSRVLQKPTEKEGVRKGNLSIGVVDYDEKGKVSIGGKAKSGEQVQVYLDNKIVGRAKASPDGEWRVEPEENVSPGIYKLRADSVSSGRVTARVEIPFSRAEKVEGLTGDSLVIVQPGNSLWRIARRTLGSGTMYTTIFAANKAQILDPDLIYPGQVFSLPRPN